MLYNFNGENTVSLDMMNQIGVSLFLYQNNSLTAVFLSGINKLAQKISRHLFLFFIFYFLCRLFGTESFYYTFTPAWFTKWKWVYYMADSNQVLTWWKFCNVQQKVFERCYILNNIIIFKRYDSIYLLT